MRSWIVAIVVALTFALVGPRLVGPQNQAANEPFSYVPPDGFVETPVTTTRVDAASAAAHAWEMPNEPAKSRPSVVVHHSAIAMQVDEDDLGKMVVDMPNAFEDCTWTHRRHEMRVRPDGARVGLIEGDCNREVDLSAAGLPPIKASSRKMQLVFPENEGSSIATISYATEQAARFEPMFEATISKAKGVATRVPPPPAWQRAAWGLAGLALGWLLAKVIVKNRDEEKREEEPAK